MLAAGYALTAAGGRPIVAAQPLSDLAWTPMSRYSGVLILLAAALTALLAGCHSVVQTTDVALESLLTPVETSPESVTLEIFKARVPVVDRERVALLWQQADELSLPTELRRRLAANGFRIGIVSGTPPEELTALLALDGGEQQASTEQLITTQTANPRVTRRVVHLRPDDTKSVAAAELVQELQVLINDPDGLSGAAYHQAQPIYELQASPAPGQRIEVKLLPEVHHGELKNRYVGSDPGIFLISPSRERESFTDLRATVELNAGDLLLVGCLEEAPGSLGQAFHTAVGSGGDDRRLIVIRMLQIPPSEILAD